MTLHLVKLCAGADGLDDLRAWSDARIQASLAAGGPRLHDTITRMHPRREAALLDGGSLYWVIKGAIVARQKIIGFERRTGADHIERTAILLDPEIVQTRASPRRAFQGWRYLTAEDAPLDLDAGGRSGSLPPELGLELAELGLL